MDSGQAQDFILESDAFILITYLSTVYHLITDHLITDLPVASSYLGCWCGWWLPRRLQTTDGGVGKGGASAGGFLLYCGGG